MNVKNDGKGGPRSPNKLPNRPETGLSSPIVENGGIAGNSENPYRVETEIAPIVGSLEKRLSCRVEGLEPDVVVVNGCRFFPEADVKRLVVAARIVAWELATLIRDKDDDARLLELRNASELFADAFPWDDEPDDDHPANDGEDHNPDGFVHATPTQARIIAAAVAERIGDLGVGPFKVTAPSDALSVSVSDAKGNPFCWVVPCDCAGKDMLAAKARATRIAESLNKTEGFNP